MPLRCAEDGDEEEGWTDEGGGAPPRFRPPPLFCQDRTGRSPPPSLHRLSLLGDEVGLQETQRRRLNIKPTAATLVTGSTMTSLKVTSFSEVTCRRPKARSSGDVQRSADTPLTWASAVCILGLRGRRRFGCRNHRLRSAPRGSSAPAPPP